MKKILLLSALVMGAALSGQAVHAADHDVIFNCVEKGGMQTTMHLGGDDNHFQSVKIGKAYMGEYVGTRPGNGFTQNYFQSKDRNLEANVILATNSNKASVVVTFINEQEPIFIGECEVVDYKETK